MGICYIVGAAPSNPKFEKAEDDLVIAADGGLDSLTSAGIAPDIIVGDMDSVKGPCSVPSAEVIRVPVEKDDSDTELAVKIARARGYRKFIIYGCIGGLLDHTLGNIALMKGLAQRGHRAVFVHDGWGAAGISDGEICFDKNAGGRISVISLSDTAEGVTIRGLKYTLENKALPSTVTLGVSNSFTGENGSISVENGALCIYTGLENLLNHSDIFDKSAE